MSVKQLLKAAFWGLIFIAAGIGSLYLFGRTTTLTCERGTKNQINCVISENLLGILDFKDENIPSLENAWVSESCDDDGCTYRVELDAARGTFHLTGYTSSGYRSKEDIANQINAFVHSSSSQPLEIKASEGILGIVLPVVFILVGFYAAFQQIRNSLSQ